jgi:hypothetical protein
LRSTIRNTIIFLSLFIYGTAYAAFPIIYVDSTDGAASDTACSGAGPATAITGAFASTSVGDSTSIGFFDGGTSLSNVAVNGSHVLYVADATAAHVNFTKITGKIPNRVSTTGHINIVTDATLVTGLETTDPMTIGQVILITGAGPAGADLFTKIATIPGGDTTVTIEDEASTTVDDVIVIAAPTVTVGVGYSDAQVYANWAIGGVRATIGGTVSRKLFNNGTYGDALPGWIEEMKSGHTETIAAYDFAMTRAGDVTSGPITLRGASGAATMPVITNSANGDAFSSLTHYQVLQDFEIRNSNATKTASVAINGAGNQLVISGMKINHSTNYFGRGIVHSGGNYIIKDCSIGYCAGHSSGARGIQVTSGSGNIMSCDISNTVVGIRLYAAGAVTIRNCVLWKCDTDNIYITHTGTTAGLQLAFIGNTIDDGDGDGIDCDSTSAQLTGLGIIAINNIFSNLGGYAINYSSGTTPTLAELQALATMFSHNSTYLCTQGISNITGLTVSGQTSDPTYANAASGIFTIGTNLKALGYPTQNIGGGMGATRSYVDIGAAQRQEAGGTSNDVFGWVD